MHVHTYNIQTKGYKQRDNVQCTGDDRTHSTDQIGQDC